MLNKISWMVVLLSACKNDDWRKAWGEYKPKCLADGPLALESLVSQNSNYLKRFTPHF